MSTIISPTPTVKGQSAAKIIKEMQHKPTEASKHGAEILVSLFEETDKNGVTDT